MNQVSIITDLLRKKHEGDVFVNDCKTGDLGHPILDAWVMKKSWSHPSYIGYEIKVSKQDFRNDCKWVNYLPYCNQLYFITPQGLIDKTEVPEVCGLIYVSKNGRMLYTKKHAQYRKIDIPNTIFRSLLMSRVKITKVSTYGDNNSKELTGADYWRSELQNKQEDKKLGWRISQIIREGVIRQVDEVIGENDKLKNENVSLTNVKDFLKSIGVNTNKRTIEISNKIKSMTGDIQGLFYQVSTLIRDLETFKKKVEDKMNVPEDNG